VQPATECGVLPGAGDIVQIPGMSITASEMLALPGGPARIEWRRSARARRVSLRIDLKAGGVVVTLPMRTSRNAGMALLMDHAEWVTQRLAALPLAIPFAPGALVPLHGAEHRIRHVPDRIGGVWVEAGEICVAGGAEFVARRVADFYRAEARRSLSAFALAKAAMAGVQARRVSVKDTHTRWGSCASDRSLAFSWRLVMAPAFVQDYVAAHEVAHLSHMNHGRHFWALVAELTPHTKAAVAWLKLNGPRLLRVG
jgi:predicted metal-dependent hydrolase